jgi:hypothetical protein
MPASFRLLVPNLHHEATPIVQFLMTAQQHAIVQHRLAQANKNLE